MMTSIYDRLKGHRTMGIAVLVTLVFGVPAGVWAEAPVYPNEILQQLRTQIAALEGTVATLTANLAAAESRLAQPKAQSVSCNSSIYVHV